MATILDGKEYETLKCFAVPCYVYKENDKHEHFWVDFQNAIYYFFEDEEEGDQNAVMKDGRKHWLISPVKPKGITINKDNENLVRWIVDYGPKEDLHKEWDFDNHCAI